MAERLETILEAVDKFSPVLDSFSKKMKGIVEEQHAQSGEFDAQATKAVAGSTHLQSQLAKRVTWLGMSEIIAQTGDLTKKVPALSGVVNTLTGVFFATGGSLAALSGGTLALIGGMTALSLILSTVRGGQEDVGKATADVTDEILRQAGAVGALTGQQRTLVASRLAALEVQLIEAKARRDYADQNRTFTEIEVESGRERTGAVVGAQKAWLVAAADMEKISGQIKTIQKGLIGVGDERRKKAEEDSKAISTALVAEGRANEALAASATRRAVIERRSSADVIALIRAEEAAKISTVERTLATEKEKATGRVLIQEETTNRILEVEKAHTDKITGIVATGVTGLLGNMSQLASGVEVKFSAVFSSLASTVGSYFGPAGTITGAVLGFFASLFSSTDRMSDEMAKAEAQAKKESDMASRFNKEKQDLEARLAATQDRLDEKVKKLEEKLAESRKVGAVAGGRAVESGFTQHTTNIFLQPSVGVQAIDLASVSDGTLRAFAMKMGRYLREAAATGQFSLT